ncbi:MAG: DUF349 domain-containing protein [Bacteroidales bacterium]|jgi:DNA-binding Lrp family transcriptional regulator|nr:DUF349 domain-containing protein [Bacteroidales bacterium]
MTNHLQEQPGAEMPQDNSQSTGDLQNVENKSIALDKTDDANPASVEEPEVEAIAETGRVDIEDETQETTVDEAVPAVGQPDVEKEEVDDHHPVPEEEQVHDAVVETVPAVENIEEEKPGRDKEDTDEDDFDEDDESEPAGKTEADYAGLSRKEIVEHLRQLLDKGDIDTIRAEIDAIKFQFYRKLKAEEELQRAEHIENGGAEDSYVYEEDEQELILKNLLNRYREIRNVHNEQMETEKQKNLEAKLKIIDELKELTGGSESIGETFQQFRDLQNRWRAVGLVPQTEVKNLWDTYHHYVEVFYDYIKINRDLRDLDFKRNLEAKIELCEKAEALLLESSVVNAFHRLQTFHEQWREIGPVPQEMRVEIWERFKTVSSQINKQHQEYFENLKEAHKKNKEAKEALCAKVAEIAQRPMNSSNQWRKNAQEIVEIQKLWNTIGYTNKKDNHKLFKRFHALCDSFFNQKREFAGQEKEVRDNNLQLKQDLCVQAEALKDSTEWKTTTDEFIRLQNKWKEIGNIPSKYRESIWKRFRAACNYFFEQKAKHYSSVDSGYDNNLKAKQALIDQIRNFVQSKNPGESFEQLKELQRQWSDIGFVPIKYKKKIQEEYREAINKQYDALRLDDSERNRLHYKSKVENMASAPKSRGKLDSERDRLMRRYQQLQSDLVVWENNIGFFSKSKNSETMIANVQRMIEQGKTEMKELEEKIRIIDSMENDNA